MNILGIDQSFTSAGYCILNQLGEVIKFGLVKTSLTDGDIFERARLITNFYKDLVDENNISLIGIEGLAYGGFGNAGRQLAGLQFLLVDELRPIEIKIIAPKTVKKFALQKLKRNNSKQELFEKMPKNLQELFLEEGLKKSKGLYDVVDAYWIALYTYKSKEQALK